LFQSAKNCTHGEVVLDDIAENEEREEELNRIREEMKELEEKARDSFEEDSQ